VLTSLWQPAQLQPYLLVCQVKKEEGGGSVSSCAVKTEMGYDCSVHSHLRLVLRRDVKASNVVHQQAAGRESPHAPFPLAKVDFVIQLLSCHQNQTTDAAPKHRPHEKQNGTHGSVSQLVLVATTSNTCTASRMHFAARMGDYVPL